MLDAKNIHKVYKTGTEELHVLKGVDLKVKQGEFVSILGPSGAGKSTLLHIVGGLDKPTQGRVVFANLDLYKASDTRRAAVRNTKIGFVFQFYHLLPEFTALENVMLPAFIGRTPQAAPHDAQYGMARQLLEAVELGNRVNHKPNQLSGGEQQRVAIARALVNEPLLLLCDEPTGNLDSETGKSIMELLYTVNREKKTTTVVVTHEEAIADQAGRVLKIKDGRLK